MNAIRVAGFGDNIIDRFLDRGLDYPGGNAVNVAVFARRLGAEAAYVGVLGDDDSGRYLRDTLERLGVRTDRCVVRDGPTGITTVDLRAGDRVFVDWNGGGVTTSAPFVLTPDDVGHLGGFDLVHSSAYSASEAELPKLRQSRCLVSFDLSSDPEHIEAAYLARVCPWVDLALLSCGQASDAETAALLARVVEAGSPLAVATRGARGAVAFDGARLIDAAADPVPPEDVVDTMGCGDAFLAAFAVALIGSGWRRGAQPTAPEIERALHRGTQVAAEQCRVESAFGHGRPSVSGSPATMVL